MSSKKAFGRVLLKLSGEALEGGEGFGIDPEVLARTAAEIKDITAHGIEVALVIGVVTFSVGRSLRNLVLIA